MRLCQKAQIADVPTSWLVGAENFVSRETLRQATGLVEALKADIQKKGIQKPLLVEVAATGRRWIHDGAHRLLLA
jgi:hypothetical protein